MAGRITRLEDCQTYTETNRRGKYIGRVRQFPDLRSSPQVKALDAITEVLHLAGEKITRLTAESERLDDGTWPVAGMDGGR